MKNKSLEALERISWRYVNDPDFQEWCNIIKQDLELLEQLKQQRDSLAINNGELCVKVTDLQKENQELKEHFNKIASGDTIIDLFRENLKLKKTIAILKCFINYVEVEFVNFVTSQCDNEEYELLKEVLE